MKRVAIRYMKGDIILCKFHPYKRYLKLTKKSSKESVILNLPPVCDDKLYPCVRISYSSDSVKIITNPTEF